MVAEPESQLPPMPTFSRSPRPGPNNDQSSDTSSSDRRPHTVHVSADVPFGEDAPLNKSPDPLPKRASRKISLSSPIFGLGLGKKDKKAPSYEKTSDRMKKDQEKEAKVRAKEREKEEKARLKEEAKRKEREELAIAPSSFPAFVMTSRI